MDSLTNPYSPGAGLAPAALVGRDEQRRDWSTAMGRTQGGRNARSMVLYGLRGVGKTVLLGDMTRAAEDAGWIVGYVEAGSGRPLRVLLDDALQLPLASLATPTAGQRIRQALTTFLSFKASVTTEGVWTFGLDLDPARGGAGSGRLELDLSLIVRDISAAAAERGTGLALLIDEAQDLSVEELTALCSISHMAGQRGWPFLLALAGLPALPSQLGGAKSYSERLFAYHQIRQLTPHDARAAIVEPAAQEDVAWDEDAVQQVLSETGCYPYFLQEYGQACWEEADDAAARITHTDARVGGARALRTLDDGFFRTRWDRATPKEREYLAAMATDGDSGSASGEVAARLGKKVGAMGVVRASLITKGLIYAPEHGRVAFTVPRMADFISRQPD